MEIQFASNLRIGIMHKTDPKLTIGMPPEHNKDYEFHILRLERYFKLPFELRVLRDKLKREALKDEKKA